MRKAKAAPKPHHRTGRRSRVTAAAGMPTTKMREAFGHEYVKDYNAHAAALRAGFSKDYAQGKASALLKEMMPFIERLQSKKNEQLMKRGIMSQDEVLQGMSNIGRVNALDYIRWVPTEIREGRAKKVVLAAQLKDITELTREQADAISEVYEERGQVRYKLPDVNEKMAARAFLGKHWGLTDPKLINLRISQNMNMNIDLRMVDSDKLELFEKQLVDALGATGLRLLGYRAGEEESEQPMAPLEVETVDDEDDEDEE
jgi:phage terminase small subunit